MSRKLTVKPCPCCGSEEIRVGIIIGSIFGVGCTGCGLQIRVDSLGSEFLTPRGYTKKKFRGRDLEHEAIVLSVKRWNRRAKKGGLK